MKSIKYRFDYFLEREGGLSGRYTPLAQAVLYQKFPKKDLVESFKKLVPKKEYLESDEKALVDYLEILTNRSREVEERIGIEFDPSWY